MKFDFLAPWAPHIRSILRILAAATFFTHGTMKLFGWPTSMGDGALPPLMLTAGILEVVGGTLLIIGLFSRPVAFVMSGLMAAAYFMAHAPQGFFPAMNGGEAALLFCWVFLYICAAGPGPISVDAKLGRA
jgi:putative oxidoreductase